MGKNTMLVSAEWVRVMGRSRTSTFRTWHKPEFSMIHVP